MKLNDLLTAIKAGKIIVFAYGTHMILAYKKNRKYELKYVYFLPLKIKTFVITIRSRDLKDVLWRLMFSGATIKVKERVRI